MTLFITETFNLNQQLCKLTSISAVTLCSTSSSSLILKLPLTLTPRKKNTLISCVCFSIQHNSKHLNHSQTLTWSPDGGYPNSEMTDSFPHRAVTSGSFGGLNLFIGMHDEDIDPLCSYAIHGLQVRTSTVPKHFVSLVGYWLIVVTPDGTVVTKQSSGRMYLCFGRHCSVVFCRLNLPSPMFKRLCNCIVNAYCNYIYLYINYNQHYAHDWSG